MGQFLSNKYLKYRAAMKGGPVSGDLPCDQCSYNLRGLRFGGACPECGTPITLRGDGDLPFHDMPLPVLKRFRASAWAATFSMLGFILLLVFYNKLASTLIPVRLLLLALIIFWLFAVWRLTPAIEIALCCTMVSIRLGLYCTCSLFCCFWSPFRCFMVLKFGLFLRRDCNRIDRPGRAVFILGEVR